MTYRCLFYAANGGLVHRAAIVCRGDRQAAETARALAATRYLDSAAFEVWDDGRLVTRVPALTVALRRRRVAMRV
jgi:hypothetical protein